MTLGLPVALAILAIAVPTVVLAYLIRQRDLRREVASVILYRVIAVPAVQARRGFARPRHWLSLALALCALAAAVLALSDPRSPSDEPRRFVIVLDTSASMGVREGVDTSTRLERALDELARVARHAGSEGELALISSGDQAVVQAGFSRDHGAVVEVARSLRAAGRGTGHAEALAIADALCAGNGAIVVLSDGDGFPDPQTGCPIVHRSIGGPAVNVGIVGLTATARGDEIAVQLAVASSDRAPRDVDVALFANGQLGEVAAVRVPPGGSTQRSLVLRAPLTPDDITIAARLSGPADALASDDTAQVVVATRPRVRVLLVAAEDGGPTAHALRLHRDVDLTVSAQPDPAAEFDLAVVESDIPAPPRAARMLVLGADPAPFGIARTGVVRDPRIVRWDRESALLADVDLDSIRLSSSHMLDVPHGGSALAESTGGAIAAVGVDGRVAAFGFGVNDSDLEQQIAFPNLISSAVEWAAAATGAPAPPLPDGVLSERETLAAPATIRGATGTRELPGGSGHDLWRIAALIAAALLAIEWLLPLWARRRTA